MVMVAQTSGAACLIINMKEGLRVLDLAHRGAAQQPEAVRTGKHRLDVAGRQPARIHLHRQSLQLLGAAPHHFPKARAK